LRLGQIATDMVSADVRLRRGQARLRELTLQSYRGRCALCDVSDRALLVASHVVPWAIYPDARGHLENIICLCRSHDALIETGYFSFTDSYTVLRRASIDSSTVRALLSDNLWF